MNRCWICGCETEGSVGAAGLKWNFICQPCKDKEDAALWLQLKSTSDITKAVYGTV